MSLGFMRKGFWEEGKWIVYWEKEMPIFKRMSEEGRLPATPPPRHSQSALANGPTSCLPRGLTTRYPLAVLRRIKDQTLVIVEDDNDIRAALTDYFGPDNKVHAFACAEDALAAESTFNNVKVFIIDYKLPGIYGAELFQQLRSRHPRAKYILITGEMNYEVAETNRALGWDALILKPFDFGILEDNISVLVSTDA
jgi:CheY-like chemotaxis protein